MDEWVLKKEKVMMFWLLSFFIIFIASLATLSGSQKIWQAEAFGVREYVLMSILLLSYIGLYATGVMLILREAL